MHRIQTNSDIFGPFRRYRGKNYEFFLIQWKKFKIYFTSNYRKTDVKIPWWTGKS